MRALTIRQPWAWAILHAGKRIENRGRRDGREPKNLTRYRGELWIHTSARMTMLDYQQGREFMMGRFPKLEIPSYYDERIEKHWMPRGCIVGRCRVVAHIDDGEDIWVADRMPQTPEQEAEAIRIGAGLDLRWYMGGYALVLADVVPALNAVPCKGNRNYWDVPQDIAERVRWAA